MYVKYDKYNKPEYPNIYLAGLDRNKICILNGIDFKSYNMSERLNNVYTLSFDVHKEVETMGVVEISSGYDLLNKFMRLHVDGYGWFVMDTPSISFDGYNEIKTVTATSIDGTLAQHDIVGQKINYGTTDSYEMLVDGNVEVDDTGVEWAKEQIKFCNKENPELSLLHIILKLGGFSDEWTVGEIDDKPKTYESYVDGQLVTRQAILSDEIGHFDIGSQSVYAFLTQDMAKFFECVILFDIENMTVNAYRAENLGKNTNVTIAYTNVENSNEITVDEDSIYTRFTVQGGDELGIRYVNFGSNIIENIDYYLNTKYMPENLVRKYKAWQQDVEFERWRYADFTREYNKQLSVISELKDRLPLDDTSTDWDTFDAEALTLKRDDYKAYLRGIEKIFEDENGDLDEEKLQESIYWVDYSQVKTYILPNIEIALSNKEAVDEDDIQEYLKVEDWTLYGLDELDSKLKWFNAQVATLTQAGYSKPWEEGSKHTQDYHDKSYDIYLNALNELDKESEGSCAWEREKRQTEIDEAQNELDSIEQQRSDIAYSVQKENWLNEEFDSFTPHELTVINTLYIDTDYVNENMFLTSQDDQVTAVDEQIKLYQAAKEELEAVSQPQYKYSTTLDDFLSHPDYKDATKNLNKGDFLWLEIPSDKQKIIYETREEPLLTSDKKELETQNDDVLMHEVKESRMLQATKFVKLRLVEIEYNPFVDDNDLKISFSNMIRNNSSRNDLAFLLDSNGKSGKNQISGSQGSSDTNWEGSISYLMNKIINSPNYKQSITNQIDKEYGGYIGQLLVLKQLEAEMIKTIDIEAENGFFQYLQSQLIVADEIVAGSGKFENLNALVAKIQSAIMGSASIETGIVLNLNANNAQISEALIKNLIAEYITVSDLKAGNINTDKMSIKSESGDLVISGSTQTFKDKDGNVRIQIGEDTNGDFTFVLYDPSGRGVIIDQDGIKDSAIEDGLIKNDMISDGTIGKDKVNWTDAGASVDSNGKPLWNVAQMTYNGDQFLVSYTTMQNSLQDLTNKYNDVKDRLEEVENQVPAMMTLTNEYIGLPARPTGEVMSFSSASTLIKVIEGTVDVTSSYTFAANPTNVTGAFDTNNRNRYVITDMDLEEDLGQVELVATRPNYPTLRKVINIAKQKGYTPLIYSIEVSGGVTQMDGSYKNIGIVTVANRVQGNFYPSALLINSKYSSESGKHDYFGKYRIYSLIEGVETLEYESTNNEIAHTFVLEKQNVESYRIDLYSATEANQLLDSQSIMCIADSTAYTFTTTSSKGETFQSGKPFETVLTAHIYRGFNEIDSDGSTYSYQWFTHENNSSEWTFLADGKSIIQDERDVNMSRGYKVTFGSPDTLPIKTQAGNEILTQDGDTIAIDYL